MKRKIDVSEIRIRMVEVMRNQEYAMSDLQSRLEAIAHKEENIRTLAEACATRLLSALPQTEETLKKLSDNGMLAPLKVYSSQQDSMIEKIFRSDMEIKEAESSAKIVSLELNNLKQSRNHKLLEIMTLIRFHDGGRPILTGVHAELDTKSERTALMFLKTFAESPTPSIMASLFSSEKRLLRNVALSVANEKEDEKYSLKDVANSIDKYDLQIIEAEHKASEAALHFSQVREEGRQRAIKSMSTPEKSQQIFQKINDTIISTGTTIQGIQILAKTSGLTPTPKETESLAKIHLLENLSISLEKRYATISDFHEKIKGVIQKLKNLSGHNQVDFDPEKIEEAWIRMKNGNNEYIRNIDVAVKETDKANKVDSQEYLSKSECDMDMAAWLILFSTMCFKNVESSEVVLENIGTDISGILAQPFSASLFSFDAPDIDMPSISGASSSYDTSGGGYDAGGGGGYD